MTHNLELATMVHALRVWRHYVLGRMGRKLELRTCHLSLKYLFNQTNLNTWQARWLEFLCEFDIKHVKGKENKVVDTLSWKFHVVAISMSQTDLRCRILEVVAKDESIRQIRRELIENPMQWKYVYYRVEEDGLILYKSRVYIPYHFDLRKKVLDKLHQAPYFTHLGYQKIVTVARKSYFWPAMKKDMEYYIA